MKDKRRAFLNLNSWAGHSCKPIFVIAETPKRYRIEAIERTKLAGRDRWIERGQTALVPKYAVSFPAEGE